MRRALIVPLVLSLAGCSATGAPDDVTLQITSDAPSLEEPLVLEEGAPARLRLHLRALGASGEASDLEGASWSVDPAEIGHFEGSTLVATAPGEVTVTGSAGGKQASESIVVLARYVQATPAAVPDVAARFRRAPEIAERAPDILYPDDGALLPASSTKLEVHFRDDAGGDLYEITVRNAYTEVVSYVAASRAIDRRAEIALDRLVGPGALDVRVRSLASTLGLAGRSEEHVIERIIAPTDGTLYYYANRIGAAIGLDGAAPGVYRQKWGGTPEPFYTTSQSGTCVGCHSLSRDASRLAVSSDVAAGLLSIVDTATQKAVVGPQAGIRASFSSFDPSGQRLVTADRGVLTLRDATTGQALATVPTGGYATQPDFAPTGDAIAYVRAADGATDVRYQGGAIVVQPFDAASGQFGTPRVVASGGTLAYPSFSPDGQWLVFARSADGYSYDNANAALALVRADGSGAPIELIAPNGEPLGTNAWPRFAPVATRDGDEPVLWLLFSSRRAFGVESAGGFAQLWMAAVYPSRAAELDADDPLELATPALRVPGQRTDTDNYAAAWGP